MVGERKSECKTTANHKGVFAEHCAYIFLGLVLSESKV